LATSRKALRAALLATDLCLYGLHAARQPGQSVEFEHWTTALQTGLFTGILALLLSFTPAKKLFGNA